MSQKNNENSSTRDGVKAAITKGFIVALIIICWYSLKNFLSL